MVGATSTYALLGDFSARSLGNQVLVKWDTLSELGTQGFDLARLTDKGDFEPLHDDPITSPHPAGEGGHYRFLDAGAMPGMSLTYRLTEIESDGNRRELGEYTLSPQQQVSQGPASPVQASLAQAAQRAPVPSAGQAEFTPRPPSASEIERVKARQSERAGQARPGAPVLPTSQSAPAPQAQAPSQSLTGSAQGATSTPSGSAPRAAVGVRESGLYRLSAAALAQALGLSQSKVRGLIQSGQLRLTRGGAEVAWLAEGKGDSLLFYGQTSPSIYDPETVYVAREGRGTRMAETRVAAQGAAGAAVFPATVSAEENHFAGTVMAHDPEEDLWFWASFMTDGSSCGDKVFLGCASRSFPLSAPQPAAGGTARLRLYLRGVSALPVAPDHGVAVALNGTLLGESRWDGLTDEVIELPFDAKLLSPDGQNQVQVSALKDPEVAYSYFYVDRLELDYPRLYLAVGDTLMASGQPGKLMTASSFATKAIRLFDLTDPQRPRTLTGAKIDGTAGSYRVRFVPANAAASYLLAGEAAVRAPASVRAMERVGDPGQGATYLVIGPGEFAAEPSRPAERLLKLRASQGLSGRFVSLRAIYDDYAAGQKTPLAIADFLDAARAWRNPPAYVLLAGKGTFDPKDYLGTGTDRLPVLLALTPGAGLIAADQLFVDFDGDGRGDIPIGRLPAATAAEFAALVTKLVAYENAGPLASRTALLLADQSDAAGQFSSVSEDAAGLLADAGRTAGEIQRLYVGDLGAVAAHSGLLAGLQSGAELLHYVGHAGVFGLDRGLLSNDDAKALSPQGQLPVMLGLTCLMNRFELPQYTALGEALLLNPNAGAAAVWASGGFSYDGTAEAMGRAFLRSALEPNSAHLGDAIQAAIREAPLPIGATDTPALYNLLGDPGSINLIY